MIAPEYDRAFEINFTPFARFDILAVVIYNSRYMVKTLSF